ncbi:MAG: hypothetical protein HC840_12255 [Leptolyngbyaceae cyanobacterium RM2_2_4]|nr:hypothetical protein [Leptolyngbyaceae cyanobacterium RM2_2_4]
MFNSSFRVFSPLRTLTHTVNRPLAGLLLSLGLVASGAGSVAEATEAPAMVRESRVLVATSAVHAASLPVLPDGVYLYGQSPEPEQVGAAYMVFEVNNNRVVGAFYMPYSSFDCFNGQFAAEQLELTVINSYEQTAHSHSVALSENSSVATTGSAIAPVGLEGYHRIQQISENDQRILTACQADLGEGI